MARADGSNPGMRWFAGVLCAAVIGALVWLSLPMIPVLAEFAGTALRTALP